MILILKAYYKFRIVNKFRVLEKIRCLIVFLAENPNSIDYSSIKNLEARVKCKNKKAFEDKNFEKTFKILPLM